MGAGHTPAPLSGGGGPSLLPRGVGAGAPVAGGPVGGGGGGGVSRRVLPALVPGGGLWYSFLALSVSPVRSLRRAHAVGAKCRPGVGGGEGRPVDRPPGGPI